MAQALNWNQLIGDLQRAGEYGTISQLYAGSAEEAGSHFEGLRETISSALRLLGQETSSTEAIFQTAPFNVAETSSPRDEPDEERIKEKGGQGRGDGIGGPLIDHDKYESGILDNLHEDNLHNAIDELDKIRNREGEHANLTDEQIREKTAAKFEEILTKNSDGEQAVLNQQQALIDKLKQQTEVDPQVIAELEESKRRTAAMRNKEREKRAEEMEKMHKEDDIERIEKKLADAKAKDPRLRNEKILTKHELSRYNHYDYLRSLQERGNISDVASWRKRFAACKTPEEQNRLLRQLLYRQHRDNRFETRQIFNRQVQKRNIFTGKLENRNIKILSRKQRRSVLNSQRQNQQKRLARKGISPQPRGFLHKMGRKIASNLSAYEEVSPEYVEWEYIQQSPQRRSSNSGGGMSPFDAYQKAKSIENNINNAKKAFDFLKSLGNIGKATEGVGSASGAVGGAGASAPVWGPIVGVILLIILIIVLVIVMIMTGPNTQQPSLVIEQVQCDKNSFQVVNGDANYASLLGQYMGIHMGPHILQPQYSTTVQQIFLDTCIMFGYQQDTLLTKGNLNSLGTLAVGTLTQRAMNPGKPPTPNGSKSIALLVYIDSASDGSAICSMVKNDPLYQWKNTNGRINWTLMNPSFCSGTQLQFLLAQTYAYTLLEQQKFLSSLKGEQSTDMLQKFKTEPATGPGVVNADGLLPTDACQNSNPNVQDPKDPDKQQIDCFADMVGEYVTYGFYLNTSTQSANLSFTPTPTP